MARKISNITKRKDGLYMGRFTVNGKRYTVYGKTINDCRDKEAQKRQELAEGIYKPGKELTVKEYYERWTEAKRDAVKETTIRTQKVLFNAISSVKIDATGQTFGNIKITKVEPEMIKAVQNSLKQDRTTRTVNDSISLVRGIFEAAVNERILTWNPAAGIRSLKRTEPQARDTVHRALSKAETAAFLKAAEEVKSSYSNLYVFLLHTGCRIGEAGAILLGDIDKKGVRISRTITRTENGGYAIGSETKTAAGRRFIPLDQDARQAINNQKTINEVFNDGGALDLSKPVFRTSFGSLLKSTNINQDIERVCKRANIERFTVHAFRDTFATRCVESGMQPKVLQDIMGHTDINMTMNLYAHSMDESKEDQLKVVNFG